MMLGLCKSVDDSTLESPFISEHAKANQIKDKKQKEHRYQATAPVKGRFHQYPHVWRGAYEDRREIVEGVSSCYDVPLRREDREECRERKKSY